MIENVVGLVIFMIMRIGFWLFGVGGLGVLVVCKEDGIWFLLLGIMFYMVGLGFLVGVDIYDCVVVINNWKVFEVFIVVCVMLGGEISVVVGFVGVGGVFENDGKWKEVNRLVFMYFKL